MYAMYPTPKVNLRDNRWPNRCFVATLCSFSRFILHLERNKSQSLHFWNYPGNKFFRNASFTDLLSKKYETIRNIDSAEVILCLVFLGKKESFLNPHFVIGLPCEFTLKKKFSLLFRKSYWSLRPNFRVIVSKPKYCTHNSHSRRDENIFCISMSK